MANARILTRDYERLPGSYEGMIHVVMIRLMLRRLTQNLAPGTPKPLNKLLQTLP